MIAVGLYPSDDFCMAAIMITLPLCYDRTIIPLVPDHKLLSLFDAEKLDYQLACFVYYLIFHAPSAPCDELL